MYWHMKFFHQKIADQIVWRDRFQMSSVWLGQGYQIGRIFAYWVIVYLRQ
jgi:hypothetical protein